MSYQRSIFDLIARLSGSENIMAVPRLFCEITGSLDAGVLLSQMIYWADRGKDPDGWFYKSYAQWYEDTFLSEYQIRKHAKTFESLGLLETKLTKVQGSPTLHYRINRAALSEWILKYLGIETEKPRDENQNFQCPSIYTETTTEITHIESARESSTRDRDADAPSDPTPTLARAVASAQSESFDGPRKNGTHDKPAPRSRQPAKPSKSPALTGPHFDGRKFIEGRIPADAGATPVEVYYESFSITDNDARLTAPDEDDLVKHCPDLALLRRVCTAYRRSGFKTKRNIQLIMDWYNDPGLMPGNRSRRNGHVTKGKSANGPTQQSNQPAVGDYEWYAQFGNGSQV